MLNNGKTILMTGGNGLVGRALSEALLQKGYTVHLLSRRIRRMSAAPENSRLKHFYWDVDQGVIDGACVLGVDAIIHLAGESIGSARWTAKRRQAIRDSRIKSISILYGLLDYYSAKEGVSAGGSEIAEIRVKTVVSASATGYYGDSEDRLLFEDCPPSDDFLGKTCHDWETAVVSGAVRFGIRPVCMRSGVVLSKAGGMYRKLRSSVSVGLGVIVGSGRQYLPWIHLQDAVSAYIFALENEKMQGAYNMVAPDQVTFGTFMHRMAKGLGKPLWLPAIPAWAIRASLGKMSELLLFSMRPSSSCLEQAGFKFRFDTIDQAMLDLESRS